jgi:nicotinate-nucleotide adenylyltransferase
MKLPAKAKPGNKLIFNKVKIGILGGTFDPAHKGHLEISKKAKKQIGLKNIIWVVTKKNPFKNKSKLSLKKRISLAKKLTISHKFIKVKYYENKINSSKTINLINYLKKDKKIEIFFIMGADNLINFHKWHRWKSISQKCNILVFDRHGYKAKSLKSITFRQLSKKRLTFVKFKKVNISSSQLRKI